MPFKAAILSAVLVCTLSFGCDDNDADVFVEKTGSIQRIVHAIEPAANIETEIKKNSRKPRKRRPRTSVLKSICDQDEKSMHYFCQGALIYRKGTSEQIIFPISALENPLNSAFDLSICNGKEDHYLSIRTGYPKEKEVYPYSAFGHGFNRIEIWVCPRFLIEREVTSSLNLTKKWPPHKWIGIFWSWSGERGQDQGKSLVPYRGRTANYADINNKTLHQIWMDSRRSKHAALPTPVDYICAQQSYFTLSF